MRIFTSKTGRTAYTPGFINQNGREKPRDFKKLRNRVILVCAVIWFGLCLHGVYFEMFYYGGWK